MIISKHKVKIIIEVSIFFMILLVVWYSNFVSAPSLNLSNSEKITLNEMSIYIDDTKLDYCWSTMVKKYTWCSGLGFYYDPYVIENLEINAQGRAFAIKIVTSSKPFIIRNCIIYNAKVGISFDRVKNGQILECKVKDNTNAIILSDTCNTMILDTTIMGNEKNGITLIRSHFNTISKNDCSGNQKDGITLQNSHKNYIYGNYVKSNNQEGIHAEDCFELEIISNVISHNYQDGIYFYATYKSMIFSNAINHNNDNGILLEQSNSNEIMENTVQQNRVNSGGGLCLIMSKNNLIVKNRFDKNEDSGINLFTSDFNEIIENEMNENSNNGIIIQDSINNSVMYNNITHNDVGVNLVCCDNTIVINNTFQENIYCIMECEECVNNIIEGNNCFQFFPTIPGYPLLFLLGAVEGISLILIVRNLKFKNLHIFFNKKGG